MEFKQRRKSADISSVSGEAVSSPFAYTAPKPSARRLASPDTKISRNTLCSNTLGRRQLSESSLDHSDHHNSNNKSTIASVIVKKLSLLLILGVAAALLYSLSGAGSANTSRSLRSSTMASLSRRLSAISSGDVVKQAEYDVDEATVLMLEDEAVKKLAQDNQKQEQEIQSLKFQVQQQQQRQEDDERVMIKTREQLQEQKARRERLVAEQKEQADQAFFEATQNVDMTVKVKHRSNNNRKNDRSDSAHNLRRGPAATATEI